MDLGLVRHELDDVLAPALEPRSNEVGQGREAAIEVLQGAPVRPQALDRLDLVASQALPGHDELHPEAGLDALRPDADVLVKELQAAQVPIRRVLAFDLDDISEKDRAAKCVLLLGAPKAALLEAFLLHAGQ